MNDFLTEADRVMKDFKIPDYKDVDKRLREAAKETSEKLINTLNEKLKYDE